MPPRTPLSPPQQPIFSRGEASFSQIEASRRRFAASISQHEAAISQLAAIFSELAASIRQLAAIFSEHAASICQLAAIFSELEASISQIVLSLCGPTPQTVRDNGPFRGLRGVWGDCGTNSWGLVGRGVGGGRVCARRHLTTNAECRMPVPLPEPIQRKRRVGQRSQREGEQRAFGVVAGDAVHFEDAAGGAAVDDGPFAAA